MEEKYMTSEQKKAARRMDAIYGRQGEIQEKMIGLLRESKKLRQENETLLKKLGWW